ncbi:MAG: PD-(D/E)XK nuclease family protein [Actinomycetota bacterium]|nr:PD-(D/E)XK nuclease family protein [Actinomycetota bacterium]
MLLELPGLPDAAAPPKPLRASVTGLVTYATCPRRFYWSEVDRLPRRFSAAARRGVELHRRIELHLRGAIPFEEAEEDNYDLSPDERSPGAAPLHDPFSAFQQSRFAGQQPLFIEAPFDLKVGRGRVRGRVDAIYPAPHGGWEVVDFKSGRPTGDLPAKVQLESYALAAREAGFAPRPPDRLTVTFAYFRDGPQEASEEVDRPWLESARRHLEELVGAIEQERYEATPSQACGTCDFLKFCRPGREWMEATG